MTIKEYITLKYMPLSEMNWDDLVTLFGAKGACGGCWCMYWRLFNTQFEQKKGAENKKLFKKKVESGAPVGILAYDKKQPIGWCAVAPRSDFVRLTKSRILKPVDNLEVWSIVCLFVEKKYREQGISSLIIEAAVRYAARLGAKSIEAYPHDLKNNKLPAPFVYTGLASAYLKAGFTEIARRSATRPIMRYNI